MNKQTQDVEGDGKAYQAGGNITIYESASSEQMAELMVAMSKQLATFTAESERKVNERLREFRESIVEEFASSSDANGAAFNDPDFQYVLGSAQEAFARKGGQDLLGDLTKLISERSRAESGTRTANMLNEAIATVGRLSSNEIAALVGIFVICDVTVNGDDGNVIGATKTMLLAPFINDMPEKKGSIEYLETNNCLSINYVITRSIESMLSEQFQGKFIELKEGENIISYIKSNFPILNAMITVWKNNEAFEKATLTSLGKVIAHSALAGKGVMKAPLEIWVS